MQSQEVSAFANCRFFTFPIFVVMKKWVAKILILIATGTIMWHNCIPHHHQIDISFLASHNKDHEEAVAKDNHKHLEFTKEHNDHHGVFSLVQLDKDFVQPSVSKIKVDLPVLYLLTPIITCKLLDLKQESVNHPDHFDELIPFTGYSTQLFSRPLPAC